MPSGMAQTRSWRSMGGEGRNPPACDGRGWKACQLLLGCCPPATDDESRHARRLGCELQAAGRGQPQAGHLADHGGKPRFPQALLHDGQHIGFAKGLGIDDPVRMQSRIHQSGGKQIAPAEAPEHRPLETGGNAGDKEGRRASEFGGRSGLDHLMQGPKGKPSPGEPLIDGSNGEGQGAAPLALTLQAPDLVPQIGKRHLLPGTHAPCSTCS